MDTGSLEYNVIVVKWGDKFSAEHVNRLYRMAKLNLTLPFNFYCHTEDPTDIYSEVNIIPLDESLPLEKWWWKLTLFKENNLSGINLYLDLDVVIQNNIDHLFDKAVKNKITLIFNDEDWTENILYNVDPKTAPEYNSSIMLWHNNENTEIYNKFSNNIDLYQRLYLGIDRFFTHEIDQNNFSDIGKKEYYYRNLLHINQEIKDSINETIKLPKFDEKGNKIGTQSYRVFFDPEKSICIFNGCHEKYFYQGMEKYLV